MNIGEAGTAAGLPTKTIRYYEEIGLIHPARAGNGYRHYSDQNVHMLAFLARARGLGFSIEECRQLMSLYADDQRASSDVKRVAQQHLSGIEDKIANLQSMHNTLSTLIQKCHGDDRPDCPILEDLSGPKAA